MSQFERGANASFTADHRECDDAWGRVEEAATKKDAPAVGAAWSEFLRLMKRHFAMEEEVLFPAFEEATGMQGGGPTAVMRHEHAQMRGLLEQMDKAAADGRFQELLDQGDTLLMIIQQHNAKEEGVLYPMADRALQAEWTALAQKLKTY